MARIGLIPYTLTAAIFGPGCLVDHELGDTDSAADTQGETSAGTTSDDSADDGGSQSNTSAPTSDATTQGEDDSSGDDATSGGMPTPTVCAPDDDFLIWEPSEFTPPIPGVDAQFAAVLGGPCATQVLEMPGEVPAWSVELDCSLSGRVDAGPNIVTAPSQISLRFTSALEASAYVGSLSDTMQLRLAASWWGMGWERWFVLTREDGTIVLDGIDAQVVDPSDAGSVSDDVLALLDGEPWHGDLSLGFGDSDCGSVDECGGEPRSLQAAWDIGMPQTVYPGQADGFGTDVRELSYGVYLAEAWQAPQAMCLDYPSAALRATAWAIEP